MVDITMPEPMTRFACNLQGCCCQGWGITFEVEEALRLVDAFPLRRRAELLRGVRYHRKGGKVLGLDLARKGPGQRCQFLREDALCEVHDTLGLDYLPTLCASFPAFAYVRLGRSQLSWDAMCPEVLERLDESDDAYAFADVPVPPGGALDRRARSARAAPPMMLGGRELPPETLASYDGDIQAALADDRLPALDQLGRVSLALALACAEVPPERLPLADEVPPDFAPWFEDCVAAHGPKLLANHLSLYRRFVFALDLEAAEWRALPDHLRFDPDWKDHLDPRAPALQPLLRRYLAHRFFSPFLRSPSSGEVVFGYGTIAHTLGTAFRYAVALSRWLDRPVDRPILKVALGAAEYLFRSFRIPPSAMPWFGLEPVGDGLEELDEG